MSAEKIGNLNAAAMMLNANGQSVPLLAPEDYANTASIAQTTINLRNGLKLLQETDPEAAAGIEQLIQQTEQLK